MSDEGEEQVKEKENAPENTGEEGGDTFVSVKVKMRKGGGC